MKIDLTQWYRISKDDGTVALVNGVNVLRAAIGSFRRPNEAIATGRFMTPFAIYSSGERMSHAEISAAEESR